MMTVKEITAECVQISAKVGDKFNIPVLINGRLSTTLGRVTCHKINGIWKPVELEMSKKFLETATIASIRDIIKHEWCHYYVTKTTGEDHGHDATFKAMCARIGCSNNGAKANEIERTVEEETLYKYNVVCDTCNKVIAAYQRMCPTLRRLDSCSCMECNNNKLRLVQNW